MNTPYEPSLGRVRRHRPKSKLKPLIAAVVVVIGIVLVISSCNDRRPLETVVIEDFGEHALVTGAGLHFSEPATLIFTFSDKWERFSEEKRALFMEDTARVWGDKASGKAKKDQIQTQYEDRMGEIIGVYDSDGVKSSPED